MESMSVWHWLLVLIFVGVFLVPWVLYIRSVQLTLEAVPPDKREMSPGTAWLLLIPLFNLIWTFFVVMKLSESFRALKAANMLRSPTDASYSVGLAMAICSALSLVAGWVPVVGWLILIASFVLWILYWVGIVNARKEILATK